MSVCHKIIISELRAAVAKREKFTQDNCTLSTIHDDNDEGDDDDNDNDDVENNDDFHQIECDRSTSTSAGSSSCDTPSGDEEVMMMMMMMMMMMVVMIIIITLGIVAVWTSNTSKLSSQVWTSKWFVRLGNQPSQQVSLGWLVLCVWLLA